MLTHPVYLLLVGCYVLPTLLNLLWTGYFIRIWQSRHRRNYPLLARVHFGFNAFAHRTYPRRYDVLRLNVLMALPGFSLTILIVSTVALSFGLIDHACERIGLKQYLSRPLGQ